MDWKFWKKKEPKDMFGGKSFGDEPLPKLSEDPKFESKFVQEPKFGSEAVPKDEFEIQPSQPMAAPASYGAPVGSPGMDFVAKDIEIVSAKLDALKASLESINQRLAHLERIAEGETKKW